VSDPEPRSTTDADLIEPYGGRLVDRVIDSDAAERLLADAAAAPEVVLRPRLASDLYLLAVGALSPLEGFMDEEMYESVLGEMALPSGLPWSIPVVLSV
jgi:sulfate adenylyltransferase